MKTLLSIFLSALFISTLSAQTADTSKPAGIQFFHGTWAEALAKSKAENKLIFLDAYATWCGPCKMMKRLTFTNAEVIEFYSILRILSM